MKSKVFALLTAFIMLFPCMHLEAFFLPDDEEPIDQFFLMAGTTGYVLWKAMDLAKEHYFRYIKIISANARFGNQSNSFSCALEEGDKGKILSFQDDVASFTISCSNIKPNNSDYIDVEVYKQLFQFLEDNEGLLFRDENGYSLEKEDDNDEDLFFNNQWD